MTNEHRTIIELSDAEQDLVAGGCIVCEPVLLTGSGKLNFHANAWDTPANGNGFNSDNGNGNGAQIVLVCPV